MLGHLEEAVEQLKSVFLGSGTTSRTIEEMIPLLGLGRREQVLALLNTLRSPETESGIQKGTEYLRAFARFVDEDTSGNRV